MATHRRYDARIDDDSLVIDHDDEPVTIGQLSEILDIVGGETYTLEYTDEQGTAPWLQTEADSTVTFDVRSVLSEMDFTAEVVTALERAPADDETSNGHPFRTELFARFMVTIWQSKGNLPQDTETDTLKSIAAELTEA